MIEVSQRCVGTIRFQLRCSGWVLRPSSQARTAISLVPSRSITSTSKDQKHQHQYLPYLFGFSVWSNVHTCHVSPPSNVTSTRVTFLPAPAHVQPHSQSLYIHCLPIACYSRNTNPNLGFCSVPVT